MNDKQPVLIIGTGALAIYFAARLSASGAPVSMLGTWKEGLRALQKNGARLILEDGRELAARVTATDDPSTCKGARLALVLVKAWQTERAAAQLRECLSAEGLAASLQNGLGNRETLVRFLGKDRVGLGITTSGATLLGPGVARSGGEGSVSIEAYPPLSPTPLSSSHFPRNSAENGGNKRGAKWGEARGISELEKLLKGAGFRVEIVPDARTLVWGKLVVSTAINPLTALLRAPNGVLLERPAARMLMAELARETAAVAKALGLTLPFADPVTAVEKVARQTAANHSSMWQDVARGAPTEIDAICGAVTRNAEALGLTAPLNRIMWNLVSALAANDR